MVADALGLDPHVPEAVRQDAIRAITPETEPLGVAIFWEANGLVSKTAPGEPSSTDRFVAENRELFEKILREVPDSALAARLLAAGSDLAPMKLHIVLAFTFQGELFYFLVVDEKWEEVNQSPIETMTLGPEEGALERFLDAWFNFVTAVTGHLALDCPAMEVLTLPMPELLAESQQRARAAFGLPQ
jgi:hypothetical protein